MNEGKRAIFFVASDQERARVTLRERFGAEEVIEIAPPWSEEVSAVDVCDADGGEGAHSVLRPVVDHVQQLYAYRVVARALIVLQRVPDLGKGGVEQPLVQVRGRPAASP